MERRGPPRSVLEVPPGEMRAAAARAYRLRPDARFLGAVVRIHGFMTGEAPRSVVTEFRDGRWRITYDGLVVGELPELPGYADGAALLAGWAEALEERHPIEFDRPLPRASADTLAAWLDAMASPGLAYGLQLIDQLWRRGDRAPELLGLAARGSTLLALQQLDRIGLGDPLTAHALATVVLARTLGRQDVTMEDALLAHVLGYAAEAAELATVLPEHAPVRLFATNRTERLRAVAERKGATELSRYLYYLRLAEQHHIPRWVDWLGAHPFTPNFILAMLKPGFDVGRYETEGVLSELLPGLVLLELWEALDDPRVPAELVRGLSTTRPRYQTRRR